MLWWQMASFKIWNTGHTNWLIKEGHVWNKLSSTDTLALVLFITIFNNKKDIESSGNIDDGNQTKCYDYKMVLMSKID